MPYWIAGMIARWFMRWQERSNAALEAGRPAADRLLVSMQAASAFAPQPGLLQRAEWEVGSWPLRAARAAGRRIGRTRTPY